MRAIRRKDVEFLRLIPNFNVQNPNLSFFSFLLFPRTNTRQGMKEVRGIEVVVITWNL